MGKTSNYEEEEEEKCLRWTQRQNGQKFNGKTLKIREPQKCSMDYKSPAE